VSRVSHAPRIRTRLTERYALRTPILNAPMALVAGGALAAGVSRAGGLGLVGGGYAGTLGNEPELATEFEGCAGARVGVGFITWALERNPAALDSALALQPACVFLSFGDPRPWAPRIHAARVPLVCQVQRVADIDAALDAGAAAVVAQGTEAGGHGGARATLPFVPEAADHLARRSPDTLLLAAGGIADGRGLAAALMLGADGVVIGTRLWAAAEALTHPAALARAVAASGDDTVRSRALDALRGVPWPDAYSFRVLRNRLTDEWAHRGADAENARGSLRAEYDAARQRGDHDIVAAVAGEAVGLIAAPEPVATLIERMTAEALARLARGASADFT
jgi:nitronate monooxygenase